MPLRDMSREQIWLLPPTLDELVPQDHPARFVAEFVDALSREDWMELGVEPEGDPLGAPAYHPRALLCVWLYGFMTNVRSCRKLEAACRDQIPFLWLTGWQHPDHNTLWRFYQRHRQSMRALFQRTVRTAISMELVDLAVQAVDGTKVLANASKMRSYNAEQLRELMDRVEKAISDLEAQNEGGEDGAPVRLPEKLADRKTLRERVRQAMEELPERERPTRARRPFRINLTDRDARPMRIPAGVVPGYNAQAMVSPLAAGEGITGMLITAAEVVDEANDAARLVPMVDLAEEVTGMKVPLTLADAGYFSGEHLAELQRRGQQVAMPDRAGPEGRPYHKDRFTYDAGTDSYICPHGQRLSLASSKNNQKAKARLYRMPGRPGEAGAVCRACPAFGACTRNALHGRILEINHNDAALRRHRAWMKTREGQQAYRLRLPPGRAAVRHPQEPHGSPEVRVAGTGQREGRMEHIRHGLQSPHPQASMAHPGSLALEPCLSLAESQRSSRRPIALRRLLSYPRSRLPPRETAFFCIADPIPGRRFFFFRSSPF